MRRNRCHLRCVLPCMDDDLSSAELAAIDLVKWKLELLADDLGLT